MDALSGALLLLLLGSGLLVIGLAVVAVKALREIVQAFRDGFPNDAEGGE